MTFRCTRMKFMAATLLATVGTLPSFAQKAPHAAAAIASKPTVVLVHRGWADGSSWAKVIPLLEAVAEGSAK